MVVIVPCVQQWGGLWSSFWVRVRWPYARSKGGRGRVAREQEVSKEAGAVVVIVGTGVVAVVGGVAREGGGACVG
jgi:hypothetical protein